MSEQALAPLLNLPEAFNKAIDVQAYRSFLATVSQCTDLNYILFSLPFKCDDPLLYLHKLNPEQEFSYFWEKANGTHVIAAGGSLHHITDTGAQRFNKVHQAVELTKKQTAHFNPASDTGFPFLGGFSFFEDDTAAEWSSFPAASLTLARRFITKKDGNTTLSIGLKLKSNDTAASIHQRLIEELNALDTFTASSSFNAYNGAAATSVTSLSDDEQNHWTHSIARAKQAIADNELKKVVLARRLTIQSTVTFKPIQVLHKLRNRFPQCYTFLVQHGNAEAFVGCSPEQLLSFNGKLINTEALAGSIGRGHSEEEDQRLKTALLNSVKNKVEHRYVVQAIEEQLAPYVGALERTEYPEIKKLANVQHLFTPMRGRMCNGYAPFLLLNQLHPTPAVGGYPQHKAFKYIRNIEPFNRGWFAGPVGWMNTDGAGEFSVAIRSGLVGPKTATLYAGCGIVADSDPAKEWEETKLKFLPMLSALNYE